VQQRAGALLAYMPKDENEKAAFAA